MCSGRHFKALYAVAGVWAADIWNRAAACSGQRDQLCAAVSALRETSAMGSQNRYRTLPQAVSICWKEYGMNRWIKGIIYITIGCVGMGAAAVVLALVLGGGSIDLSNDDMAHWAKKAVNVMRKMTGRMGRKGLVSVENDETWETGFEPYDSSDHNGEWIEYQEDGFDYDESDYEYHLLTADSTAVQNLRINLRHGSLDIDQSEDHNIRVFLNGSKEAVKAEYSNGEVTIEDLRKGDEGRSDVDVYLKIPETFQFNDVSLQMDAGVVETDCSIEARNLSLNADAADISLRELYVDAMHVTVGAGVVDIEEGRFGTADLDCGVGEIDIETLSISRDSKITCGMGSVEIEMEEDTAAFNYVVSCGMGGIEIGDNNYSGISKARKIDNGASATITLDCGMGSIHIS